MYDGGLGVILKEDKVLAISPESCFGGVFVGEIFLGPILNDMCVCVGVCDTFYYYIYNINLKFQFFL